MERFWLKSYPPDVPADVDPQQLRTLKELVERACVAFADRVAFVQMDAELTYRDGLSCCCVHFCLPSSTSKVA